MFIDGLLEQIKGQGFTVEQFLGPKVATDSDMFTYRSDDKDNRKCRFFESIITLHDPLFSSMVMTIT